MRASVDTMTSSSRTDPSPSPSVPDDRLDVRTIHLSGELDMLTAPYVWADVRRQLADASCGVVALDLSALSYLGVGGLNVLDDLRRSAAELGRVLLLTGRLQRPVARLLELVGWDVLPSSNGHRPGRATEDRELRRPRLSLVGEET
jgi:anti-anti-sigma factor